MKCYNHPTIDAVAICKSCARGLCPACAAEVDKSTSCRNRCEADVAALNDLVMRGRTAYQKSSSHLFRAGIFILLLGATFFVVGLLSSTKESPNYFLIIMGVLFIGWSFSQFGAAKKMNQK